MEHKVPLFADIPDAELLELFRTLARGFKRANEAHRPEPYRFGPNYPVPEWILELASVGADAGDEIDHRCRWEAWALPETI